MEQGWVRQALLALLSLLPPALLPGGSDGTECWLRGMAEQASPLCPLLLGGSSARGGMGLNLPWRRGGNRVKPVVSGVKGVGPATLGGEWDWACHARAGNGGPTVLGGDGVRLWRQVGGMGLGHSNRVGNRFRSTMAGGNRVELWQQGGEQGWAHSSGEGQEGSGPGPKLPGGMGSGPK